jgi:hypothetical protein
MSLAALKFTRKIGTTWEFPLTWLDRNGDRQTIAGSTAPTAKWRTQTSDAVVLSDTSGFTTDETASADTFGDFTYKVSTATQTSAGFVANATYRVYFTRVINGDTVPCPEQHYMIVDTEP